MATRRAVDNVDGLGHLLQPGEAASLEIEKGEAHRRLAAARFPTLRLLENLDFIARPSVHKILVAELARCELACCELAGPSPATAAPREAMRTATALGRTDRGQHEYRRPPSEQPAPDFDRPALPSSLRVRTRQPFTRCDVWRPRHIDGVVSPRCSVHGRYNTLRICSGHRHKCSAQAQSLLWIMEVKLVTVAQTTSLPAVHRYLAASPAPAATIPQ